MVLLALRLHGYHLSEEKETLVDVLALLLPLACSAGVAHATLISRVRPMCRAVRAGVADGRSDGHACLARRVMDVCSLGTC